MIVVTVKVDWGQETIQEILPELKRHVEITLQGVTDAPSITLRVL